MRTFIALLPSTSSISALTRLQEKLELKRTDKKTPREKLHMTLVFCGDIDTKHVQNLAHLLMTTELTSPFSLAGNTLSFFGHPQTKRLVLEMEKTPLIEALHTITIHEMSRAGIPLDSSRPFKPHITLAKIKSRLQIPDVEKLPTIEFTEMVLFESILKQNGSTFRPLSRVKLHT